LSFGESAKNVARGRRKGKSEMTEEERIKALEDKLLKVVRALIAYTERDNTASATQLRMNLYASGVMPNLYPPRIK
jgi:hypothetical protein